jgi:hypothetical protein
LRGLGLYPVSQSAQSPPVAAFAESARCAGVSEGAERISLPFSGEVVRQIFSPIDPWCLCATIPWSIVSAHRSTHVGTGTWGVTLKHQLNIHLDYSPITAGPSDLEVRYSYPHSGEHSLREQELVVPARDMDPALRADIDFLVSTLVSRIPTPVGVRLPHALIPPKVEPGILTFVVLDQSRAERLPIARLTYYEVVKPLESRIEGRVCLEKEGWTSSELDCCRRIQAAVKGLAWHHYKRLMDGHLSVEKGRCD